MKQSTWMFIFAAFLLIVGFLLIAAASNWMAAAGVFLMMWANNIGNGLRDK